MATFLLCNMVRSGVNTINGNQDSGKFVYYLSNPSKFSDIPPAKTDTPTTQTSSSSPVMTLSQEAISAADLDSAKAKGEYERRAILLSVFHQLILCITPKKTIKTN
jgi:hypothetical protein